MATTVYIGHDNPIDWVLQAQSAEGEVENINAGEYQRFVLEFTDGTSVDSDIEGIAEGGIFDLSVDVLVGTETVRALRLRPGLIDGITAGSTKVRLMVYNSTYPEGLVWQDKVALKFVD